MQPFYRQLSNWLQFSIVNIKYIKPLKKYIKNIKLERFIGNSDIEMGNLRLKFRPSG